MAAFPETEEELPQILPTLWPNKCDYEFKFGDEMWDKGLQLIEFYVNIERNKNNVEALDLLNNYLYSKTLYYGKKLRELVSKKTEEANERYTENIYESRLQYYNNQLSIKNRYIEAFNDVIKPRIKELHKNELNISIISEYFTLIYKIAALEDGSNDFDQYNFNFFPGFPFDVKIHFQILNNEDLYLKNNLYPLISEDGQFGFNTWLHAFFNRIFIIGCPIKNADFDQTENNTPKEFIDHDFSHTNGYFFFPKTIEYMHPLNKISAESMQKYIDYGDHLYRKILKDDLPIILKKFFTFVLFLNYHEFTLDINRFMKIEHYLIENPHLFEEGKYYFAEICINHLINIPNNFGRYFLTETIYDIIEPYYKVIADSEKIELLNLSAQYTETHADFEKAKPFELRWHKIAYAFKGYYKNEPTQSYIIMLWQYMKYSLNTLKEYLNLQQ